MKAKVDICEYTEFLLEQDQNQLTFLEIGGAFTKYYAQQAKLGDKVIAECVIGKTCRRFTIWTGEENQ